VHTVRTIGDSRTLRAELKPGVKVVVVGAGFIGSEIASTARQLGLDVTVVEAAPAPLAGPLGVELGLAVAGLHEQNGVRLHCGVPVADLMGNAGRVTGIRLVDGTVLAAEVVVVGIGAAPAVDWLAGSGLDLSVGVACSATGATAIPEVWAVGDCAGWYDAVRGAEHRIEHWTDARDRPAVLVAALLGRSPRTLRAPYFWSDQYGVKIQFAGWHLGGEEITIETGRVETGDVLALYRRNGVVTGVLGMNQPRLFNRYRKQLPSPSPQRALDPAV
jgi:NADPH-dependent 2,4-dienoyl-CoA reductase/sulfur reductase-like enzyme